MAGDSLDLEAINNQKNKNGFSNGAYIPDSGYAKEYNGTIEKPPDKSSTADSESEDGEKKKKKEKTPMVGVFKVFRFANCGDYLLITIGFICSCIVGASLPLIMIIFGDMIDIFVNQGAALNLINMYWDEIISVYPNATEEYILENPEIIEEAFIEHNMTDKYEEVEWAFRGLDKDFIEEMNKRTIHYVVMGCIVLVTGYLDVFCWMRAAYRQGQRIRTKLFFSILRQEIGWFDTSKTGELNSRLADDVIKIQEGIGDKLGAFCRYSAQFIGGFVVGFIYGWELTLVITAVSPLLVICGGIMSQLATYLTEKELNAYAKAGAIAEEVLSSIRTVFAFSGEEKEATRYSGNLIEARNFGVRKSMVNGLGTGLVYAIMFCSYGLAFWYGAKLVRESMREMNDDYTAGTMITIFYSVLIGAFSIGVAAPKIAYYSAARGAAYIVYNIIDAKPISIDSSSDKGKKLKSLTGNIEFKNVYFKYPSRPDIPILNGLDLTVERGQTVALVGSSGCGKSTTVQLIQRYYDTEHGDVCLDGVNVRDLNVQWLRQQIGVVSQEPVLFDCSIGENISYGKDGATQQEIEDAAKNANAHDFIMNLPKKYDTLVGERGAQLSGGQKQRIAIARALVRDPKILLLDEATSALDMESESIVQSALDKARSGRTTIVVAHRLSTIRTADVICGVDKGIITEKGTHDELMALGKIYHTLVTNQTLKEQEEKEQIALGLKQIPITVEDSDDYTGIERQESRQSHRRRQISFTRSMSTKSDTGEEEKDSEPSFMDIMRLNSPEWVYILIGCIGATITGLVQPAFAVIFSKVVVVFTEVDLEKQEDRTNLYSLLFVAIGVVNGLSMFLEGYMFGKSGEYLTMRLRELCFRGLLKQDLSYYDDPEHSTGALCTRLSNDASAVQGATGARLGMVIRAVSSLVTGVIIGFVYSWQLTLVFLAFAPFLVMMGLLEMSMMKGNNAADKEALESAGKIAVEAIENMRTVSTLTKQPMFFERYVKCTLVPFKQNMIRLHFRAIAYAISQSFVFFAFAGGFRFGAYLVDEKGLSVDDMFMVFGAVVFSAMMAGEVSAFGPDAGKATAAAGRVFDLLDRQPLIDSSPNVGDKMLSVQGRVELNDVYFNYPTRPKVPILKGLTIKVDKGQTLAFVGPSGCGKSTSVQLVERFYDPKSGQVRLDGNDITGLNVPWLRGQMGLVSQEPILFNCSIKDNIAYGDNTREVPMSDIIEAARKANIHNFISSLPDGYDTNAGAKGTQLSGGQKQRIAIARALVRDPKILLLDEATSALDTESEKVVQEALDNASEGRTCIIIAHRLSTVYNADIIAVISNGVVAEQGTHSELLAKRGLYYKLNTIQSR